jgi:hypothetical protein
VHAQFRILCMLSKLQERDLPQMLVKHLHQKEIKHNNIQEKLNERQKSHILSYLNLVYMRLSKDTMLQHQCKEFSNEAQSLFENCALVDKILKH